MRQIQIRGHVLREQVEDREDLLLEGLPRLLPLELLEVPSQEVLVAHDPILETGQILDGRALFEPLLPGEIESEPELVGAHHVKLIEDGVGVVALARNQTLQLTPVPECSCSADFSALRSILLRELIGDFILEDDDLGAAAAGKEVAEPSLIDVAADVGT